MVGFWLEKGTGGKNNPEAAWEFLSKADLALESVNSTLRVGVETDSTKKWQKMNLANNKPASSKASKGHSLTEF